MQINALTQAGCEKIITDKMSGSIADRPGLLKLKDILRKGDTLVVWRLDRLGRTLKHLLFLINDLHQKGIGFHSLHETIDTTSPIGRFTFHLFASLAEFERNIIAERSKAGLAAARARERVGGRPDPDKEKVAIELYESRRYSVKQICDMMGISRPTLYTYVKNKK